LPKRTLQNGKVQNPDLVSRRDAGSKVFKGKGFKMKKRPESSDDFQLGVGP